MRLLIAIILILVCFLFFVITYIANSKYKSDEVVRGFKGNCETCGKTSCSLHPKYNDQIKEDEDGSDTN